MRAPTNSRGSRCGPLRLLSVCAFSLLWAVSLGAQESSLRTIAYSESNTDFANPERGFYWDSVDDLATLASLRERNISLVQIKMDLLPFASTDIAPSALDQLRAQFANARSHGLKVIFRAAYGFTGDDYYSDPELDHITRHIAQIATVLNENQDVLYVVQAGLLGPWGEWHGSNHGNPPSLFARKTVVSHLLREVEPPTFIQIRRPMFIRDLFAEQPGGSELTAEKAYTDNALARVGWHNDALLSGPTDMGTYVAEGYDREQELDWSNQHGRWTPFGGESASLAPQSHPDNAIYELEKLHASYLNLTYHPDVIQRWEGSQIGGETAMERISKRLGYRLVAESLQVSASVPPGGILRFHLEIKNVGFASPHLPRAAHLILQKGDQELTTLLPDNVRQWDPEKGIVSLAYNLRIPSGIEAGDWALHLHLPDPSPSLSSDGRFSIRLANEEIPFDPVTGYNTLLTNLKIDASARGGRTDANEFEIIPNNGLNPETSLQSLSEIGPVSQPGFVDETDGTFSIQATGFDIWETQDVFVFAHQNFKGDGELIVRVNDIEGTHPWAKTGLMLRQSLSPGSRHVMAILSFANGVALQRREQSGGISYHKGIKEISAPCWLKLTRRNHQFSGYYSKDGIDWQLIDRRVVEMPFNLHAGLATASLNNDRATVAVLDNLTVADIRSPVDSDGDGVLPLLEYAFGGSPESQDATRLPVFEMNRGDGAGPIVAGVTFNRRLNSELVLDYALQQSLDLIEWNRVDAEWAQPLAAVQNSDGVTESVRLEPPVGALAEDQSFYRMKILLKD